jgi:hypothetical protein
MPLSQRMRYQAYMDNRELIESRRGRFGDRWGIVFRPGRIYRI